jgi:mono/diheme cytochrome c family protein
MTQLYQIAALSLLTLVIATPAQASGLAREGEALAKQWCAECHVVSDDQAQGSADVPSFDAIAQEYANAEDAFRALLADPHPDMPQMMLTRQDIRNLLAYLESRN